jgi:hypothetical protein
VRWFRRPEKSYPFAGRVDRDRFSIARVVRGQDSFNPMLYGRLTAAPEGTKVKVLFTFHPAVWAILLCFSAVLTRGLLRGEVMAVFALCLLWMMAIVFFYLGVSKSTALLNQRLDLHEASRRSG